MNLLQQVKHRGDVIENMVRTRREKATHAITAEPELAERIKADIRAAILERKITPGPMPLDDSFDDADDADG